MVVFWRQVGLKPSTSQRESALKFLLIGHNCFGVVREQTNKLRDKHPIALKEGYQHVLVSVKRVKCLTYIQIHILLKKPRANSVHCSPAGGKKVENSPGGFPCLY